MAAQKPSKITPHAALHRSLRVHGHDHAPAERGKAGGGRTHAAPGYQSAGHWPEPGAQPRRRRCGRVRRHRELSDLCLCSDCHLLSRPCSLRGRRGGVRG